MKEEKYSNDIIGSCDDLKKLRITNNLANNIKRLLKEFKFLYDDETIKNIMFVESQEYVIIECVSGYAYKVEYNGGNITTTCLNY